MKHTYPSALVLFAVVLPIPILATFITVGLYIILAQQFTSPYWLNWVALLSGLGLTLVIWLLAGMILRRSTTAKGVNELSYDAIMQELRRLEVNYFTIEGNQPEETFELEEPVEAAVTAGVGKGAATDEMAVTGQSVGPVGTDEMAVTVQPVEAVGTVEAEGATEPTQASSDSAGLKRAYAALWGENEGETIEDCLKVHGRQWIRGTGYINIWKRLQTADVEMISLLPIELVQCDADYDLLRLEGSTIPNNRRWIEVITKAKATLDRIDKQKKTPETTDQAHPAEAEQQLLSPTVPIAPPAGKSAHAAETEQQLLSLALLDLVKETVTSPQLPLDDAQIPKSFGPALFALIQAAFCPPLQSQAIEEQARADLRRARIAIGTYISSRWSELIQFRNLLFEAAFVASILVYSLFVIAIIDKAPAASLIAALAYYFIGAIVGLYVCLASKPKIRDKPGGDQSTSSYPKVASFKSFYGNTYGLGLARIIVTTVFSGLAAILGVGLVAILSISLLNLTAVPSNAATTFRPMAAYPSLDHVYSLPNNVQGVIFAVIFGFLSSLVIGTIQKEVVTLQSQIRSTDPGE